MSKEKLKQYGTTFHFAAGFLSKELHETAANLYAICREIDDLADRSARAKPARQGAYRTQAGPRTQAGRAPAGRAGARAQTRDQH